MTHEDQMRSLRLMGEEVIPAVREMGQELELFGPFEVDPGTGQPLNGSPAAAQPVASQSVASEPRRSMPSRHPISAGPRIVLEHDIIAAVVRGHPPT